MWVAENWKDYEVLDTSCGEKLERWGNYILQRPDPQVIWNTAKKIPQWKQINAHYHRSNKGGGEWEFIDLPQQWSIDYQLKSIGKTLTFNLKPFSFKHTGLFPEQAVNWEWFTELIDRKYQEMGARAEDGEKKIRVLNLFAYTGGATLAAAAAGAHVTHVDASKGMVGWAKENAASSGIDEHNTRWLVDDCRKFVEREIRRGNKYEGIIMDPPSYGRGPKGEIWKIEDSIYELIELSSRLLSDEAIFFLVNSYTTGLQPGVLKYMLSTVIVPKLGGKAQADEVGLPVSGGAGKPKKKSVDAQAEEHVGLVLPCGAAGRWSK